MAFRENYLLAVFQPSADRIREHVQRIVDYRFDGILSNYYDLPYLPDSIPVVYAEKSNLHPESQCFHVKSQEEKGGCELCREVLALGHRQIVILSNDISDKEHAPRYQGILQTLKNAGIPDAAERLFFVCGQGSYAIQQTLCQQVFRKYPDTTVIMALTDPLAFRVYHVMNALEIPVPQRISITGYGHLPFDHPTLRFTTIDQHPYDIGMRACKKLIDLLENKGSEDTPPVEFIPTTLIRGTSLGVVPIHPSALSPRFSQE